LLGPDHRQRYRGAGGGDREDEGKCLAH
jgi:hypothetical protein